MNAPYKTFLMSLSLNAIAMFFLGYGMIASLKHFYLNINAVYMTFMMIGPMAILMLYTMRSMYPNKKMNTILYACFGILFIASFAFTRIQTPVGNQQFLRSMIPHHSSAILMCTEANISDPEIIRLCQQIVKSQNNEIIQMKQILTRIGTAD